MSDTSAPFHRIAGSGSLVIVADAYRAEIERLDLTAPDGLDRWLARGAHPVPGGRARGWRVGLPESGDAVHLRELAHGGLLRRLTGRRFWGLARAVRALEAARVLRGRGVDVPAPILLRAVRHGLFWNIELANEFVEGGVSGGSYLDANEDPIAILQTARDAGRSVRAFHDAGASHPDLQIDNLLVLSSPKRVLVTDLDGVRIAAPPDPARRMRELGRLYRSLSKRGLPEARRRRCAAAFFAGYVCGDRTLRAALLRRRGVEARRLALHELGYPRDAQRIGRLDAAA